jgi:DNA-binding IclR family transcriptional regulator
MNEATKEYRLGPKLWELGSAFAVQSDLNSAAVPYMKRLAEECGESVFLGIMDEGEVIYVRQIESPKSVLAVRKLGQQAPAYCTATGEAMMAFTDEEEVNRLLEKQPLEEHTRRTETSREEIERRLAEIRRCGVAVVDGEYNAELLCVSAPVLNKEGQARASLTVALLSERATSEHVRYVSKLVHGAAQDLSGELGFVGRIGEGQARAASFHETNAEF